MFKLAIIITHPIQYYAPVFQMLAKVQRLSIKVFYTWDRNGSNAFDPGFGKTITWDIPLLEGYDFTFVKNTSSDPGSHHFHGISNPTLISEVESWGAQAILVYGWSFASHLKALRYFKGKIPVYFRGDSHLLNEIFGFKKFLRRLYLKWVYSYVDKAFYVGHNNKQHYLASGLTQKQLVFAPHAIDNDRFSDNTGEYSKQAEIWRNNMGISSDDMVFLFAGKFEPNKNPILLLKIFLKLNLEEVFLVLIGNGELEENLKIMAAGNPNVHFVDFQNQTLMPIVYRLGDIFVLPSQSETWGLAVNEAMACELPILVSNKVGCAVDLVHDSLNGYIFDSGNEVDLLRKMQMLIENKAKLRAMGKESLKVIVDWSVQNQVKYIAKEILHT